MLTQEILTGITIALASLHAAGLKLNIKGTDLILLLETAAAGVLTGYTTNGSVSIQAPSAATPNQE